MATENNEELKQRQPDAERAESLRAKSAALIAVIEEKLIDAVPSAQASYLVAHTLATCVTEMLPKLTNAIESLYFYAEIPETEDEFKDDLGLALERYRLALAGLPQPALGRKEFGEQWTAQTGTSAEALKPYFEGVIEAMLPVLEDLMLRAETKVSEAQAVAPRSEI